jgi:hypothetical protein
MLKAITHFEQVPLQVVMKIVERDKQTETSEESRLKDAQNLSSIPAASTTGKEDQND